MREVIVATISSTADLCFTLAVVYFIFVSDINARLTALENQNAASPQETQAAP